MAENVDDDELHWVLDIGCVQCLSVGARVKHAWYRAVVVRTRLLSTPVRSRP